MKDALRGLSEFHLQNTALNFSAYLSAEEIEGGSAGEESDF